MPRSITQLLFLLLVNSLFLCPDLGAQSFTGQVRSADSAEPLHSATVWLPGSPQQGALTDADGWFSMPTQEDSAWVEISYLGYETFKGRIHQGDTLWVLLQSSTTAMQTVVVKAERMPARQFATEQINRLDVYLNPASKADVLLAVNSLPAATNPDETANVSLRGTPAEATGIVLNRVPLRDAVRLDQPNGVGQFSIFNTAIIDRVTVFPSNGPLSLGQSTAGIVALSTSEDLPTRSR